MWIPVLEQEWMKRLIQYHKKLDENLFESAFQYPQFPPRQIELEPKPNTMSDFKSRLVTEQAELKERIDKLQPYIGSEHFKTIETEQQRLLKIQLPAMKVYYEILSQRIELL